MNETLAILEKVNAFYSNAWTQLITFTFAILGLVGVVIPIIVQIIQNRSFKIDKGELKNFMKDEIDRIKTELKKEIDDYAKKQSVESEKKLAIMKGTSFQMQGNVLLDKKQYSVALKSFITSASCYLDGEEELNLRRVLNRINVCLLQMNKTAFEGQHEDNKKQFDDFSEKIEEKNQNRRYTDIMKEIITNYNAALCRVNVKH